MIEISALSHEVISAAMAVHSSLGPGLLESPYRQCLVHELRLRGLKCVQERPSGIEYKGLAISRAYKIDIEVEDAVLVEVKCVRRLHEIDRAQLTTYMRFSSRRTGILINFNVPYLRDGVVSVHR